MPANGLRVDRYDFAALHSMWRISKGLMCLSTSGNYTHVEIASGRVEKKIINNKVLRRESNLRLCDAGAYHVAV